MVLKRAGKRSLDLHEEQVGIWWVEGLLRHLGRSWRDPVEGNGEATWNRPLEPTEFLV